MTRKPKGDQALTPAQRMAQMRVRKAKETAEMREALKVVESFDARLTEMERCVDGVLARLGINFR